LTRTFFALGKPGFTLLVPIRQSEKIHPEGRYKTNPSLILPYEGREQRETGKGSPPTRIGVAGK